MHHEGHDEGQGPAEPRGGHDDAFRGRDAVAQAVEDGAEEVEAAEAEEVEEEVDDGDVDPVEQGEVFPVLEDDGDAHDAAEEEDDGVGDEGDDVPENLEPVVDVRGDVGCADGRHEEPEGDDRDGTRHAERRGRDVEDQISQRHRHADRRLLLLEGLGEDVGRSHAKEQPHGDAASGEVGGFLENVQEHPVLGVRAVARVDDGLEEDFEENERASIVQETFALDDGAERFWGAR
mmetsp:Transcript_10986/g.27674  ORF Transcript_10986/g.27674 Transcript_10986/m.27674 type:complete len:234 (+) Transcript_10986:1797-2498(+)